MKRFERKKLEKNIIFRLENILQYVIILFLVTILMTQLLYLNKNFGVYLNNTYKLEGLRIEEYYNILNSGWLIIESSDENQSEILVNGRVIGNFENKSLKIFVKNNDVLEVNSTKDKRLLSFKIIMTSKNVEFPKVNYFITTDGNIEILGRVKLK